MDENTVRWVVYSQYIKFGWNTMFGSHKGREHVKLESRRAGDIFS